MPRIKAAHAAGAALFAAAIGLSACAQSSLRLAPDFGSAVRQDAAAQVADPDAHYLGTPAPGTDSARVALAQKLYEQNKVIQPTTLGASSQGVTQGGSNGSGPGTGVTGTSSGTSSPGASSQ